MKRVRIGFLFLSLGLIFLASCTPKTPWDGTEPITDQERVTMQTCDCLYTFYKDAAGVDIDHLIKIIPKYKKDQKRLVEDKMTIPEFREKWQFELDEIQKGQKQMETWAATDCGKKALEASPIDEQESLDAAAYFRGHCRYIFLFEQKF